MALRRILISLLIITSFSFLILSCNEASKNEASPVQEVNNLYNPGSEWTLNWSDEFEGETIDTNSWNAQIVRAGRFNNEWQRYTDSELNSYIKDDCMVIKAIHESDSHGMNQYTSARMNTANKFTFKYGKLAARIKLPKGQGMWPAFWMLGANINENGGDTPWPQCGEIDILEMYGTRDNGVVEGNAHYANNNNAHTMMGAVPYKLKEGIFADDFHVFSLEWDDEQLVWAVDGQEYATMSIKSDEHTEFHKEFFILLNIAVGGNHAGRPDDSTIFPQLMFVDWVRVYKLK